jgi:hypothetical protein
MRAQRTLAPVRQAFVSRSTAAGLAFLIGLVLLSDLAVVGVYFLDSTTDLVSGKTTGTAPAPEIRPGPGQAFVSGEVERLAADKAQGAPLRSPFTITGEPGVARLSIEKALVGGRRVTISWDGGTPLPISGDGGLELGATHVELDGTGVTWSLDGAARTFMPGTYSVGAPVAVGTGGLAAPREGVEFTADDQTVLASRGNAVVHLDPTRVELKGPGTLEVNGKLRVQYPERHSQTSSVRFGEGPFQVTVEPAGEKLRVNAVLQGDVSEG